MTADEAPTTGLCNARGGAAPIGSSALLLVVRCGTPYARSPTGRADDVDSRDYSPAVDAEPHDRAGALIDVSTSSAGVGSDGRERDVVRAVVAGLVRGVCGLTPREPRREVVTDLSTWPVTPAPEPSRRLLGPGRFPGRRGRRYFVSFTIRLTLRLLPAASTTVSVIVAVTFLPSFTAVLIFLNAALATFVLPFGLSFSSSV